MSSIVPAHLRSPGRLGILYLDHMLDRPCTRAPPKITLHRTDARRNRKTSQSYRSCGNRFAWCMTRCDALLGIAAAGCRLQVREPACRRAGRRNTCSTATPPRGRGVALGTGQTWTLGASSPPVFRGVLSWRQSALRVTSRPEGVSGRPAMAEPQPSPIPLPPPFDLLPGNKGLPCPRPQVSARGVVRPWLPNMRGLALQLGVAEISRHAVPTRKAARFGGVAAIQSVFHSAGYYCLAT